jgi:pyridoxamine 5'-phosphate oxidase family protein
MFSEKETEYIKSQRLARIATVSPQEMQPDIVPVGFDFDGTNFYVGGRNLLNSTK